MLMEHNPPSNIRHDWTKEEALKLLQQPFNDLVYGAQKIHRLNFKSNEVQLSTLMNIKTGGCPEDCAYCPQSAHYKTGVETEKLATVEEVMLQAEEAKNKGATGNVVKPMKKKPRKPSEVQDELELLRRKFEAEKLLIINDYKKDLRMLKNRKEQALDALKVEFKKKKAFLRNK